MTNLRWGIAGAGRISNDFAAAVKGDSNPHHILAVAARSKERAVEFAAKFDIERSYDSYEELAKDKDIDIVYIGVINTEHEPVAKLMMQHKKHVLCEKPLCVNHSQVTSLIQLAKSQNVFLMEAIWSRCSPVYEKLKQELCKGTIGEIQQVQASFCIATNSERVKLRKLGGGGLLDIGIYTLQLATLVFGAEPVNVHAIGTLNEEKIDEYGTIIMKFGERGIATLVYSINQKMENTAYVIGSKGVITIQDPFWTPAGLCINNEKFEITFPKSKYPMNFVNSGGLKFEADHVRDCLQKNLLESPLMPHSETLLLSKLRDEIRKQIGVKYDGE